MEISDLNRDELIQYLQDFVEGMENHDDLSEEERDFVKLHRKVIWELSHDRIYKVSTADLSHINTTGLREFDIQYFASLGAAKKELKKRVEALAANPFVAGPDEVQSLGVKASMAPDLVQSVITNSDVKLEAPGRFKFYEVRMLQNGQIIPVQFILTNVHVSPAGFQDVSPHQSSRPANEQHVAKIIPFNQIGRSSL